MTESIHHPREAAFFDLDGTLLDGTMIPMVIHYAINEPTLLHAGRRLGGMLVRGPKYARLDREDRAQFNAAFYRNLKGLSRDRVELLSQDLCALLRDHELYPGAAELVARERDAGRSTAMVTGSLDIVAEPIARHLGIEHVGCNRLAFDRRGITTGELLAPVMAGPAKVAWMKRFAQDEGIDLARSRAYADDSPDVPMLSAVGHPVAVNPKRGLAETAARNGWPTLILGRARTKDSVLRLTLGGAATLARMLERRWV